MTGVLIVVIDLMDGQFDDNDNLVLKNPISIGREALTFDLEVHPNA